jgi:ABC-type Mn2+/Zn2+ transport system permease subunit
MKNINLNALLKIMLLLMIAICIVVFKQQLKISNDFYIGIATILTLYIGYLLIKKGDEKSG